MIKGDIYMAKGVLYIMTTVVDGLIKIGKTQTTQFENRMYQLESNGYKNVTGLKRKFAIEVEDYDEKEVLLHNIFDRSRVPNTELFALNADLAVSLLSALEGSQIYPQTTDQTKAQVFSDASESVSSSAIPDGTYHLQRKNKSLNKDIKATMQVNGGKFKVLTGSDFCPTSSDNLSDALKKRRKKAKVHSGKLATDETFDSASYAAMFVLGNFENGLTRWKDKNGKSIKDIIYSGNDD